MVSFSLNIDQVVFVLAAGYYRPAKDCSQFLVGQASACLV